ncbi:MAG: aminotransferase class I/II-fold pyridoxal phosphate-dependent enzyme [Oscillospiraceae bacterium]|nr:aminotransferase class I/II-fold pyridoxal phosphate-dependent enzyme [Oscillospiraceae bacterium]
MKPLYDAVMEYANSFPYAFHTPGHKLGKGFSSGGAFFDVAGFDLTELPETDNLHYPEGPVKRAQELAAIAFHSARTWFLVNGSTCGVHAMITAACRPGSKLIISRDFHMSAYNGMTLACVKPCYTYPPTPRMIRQAADKNPDAVAVYVTRPSYFGEMCELEEIVEIAHSRNMRVLVDEAHGAHLVFSEKLPFCAMDAGADLCVQSAHKTLVALTQGAYMHASAEAVKENSLVYRIETALRSIQTSSPSYIIMSSLDYARENMQEHGSDELDRLLFLCEDFYKCMEKAGYGVPLDAIDYGEAPDTTSRGAQLDSTSHSAAPLDAASKSEAPGATNRGAQPRRVAKSVNGQNRYRRDITRLVLNTRKIGLTGVMAEAALFNKFNIRIETSDIDNIVMIATIADTEEDFRYLKNALYTIANEARDSETCFGSCAAGYSAAKPGAAGHNAMSPGATEPNTACPGATVPGALKSGVGRDRANGAPGFCFRSSEQPEIADAEWQVFPENVSAPLCFYDNLHREAQYSALTSAAGMTAAALVTPYPPGIPLLCPGEIITPELVEKIVNLLRAGIKINGIDGENRICVYRFPAGV